MEAAENPTLLEDASTPDSLTQAIETEGDVFTETESLESDAGEESEQPTVELGTIAQLMGLSEDDLDVDDDGTVVFRSKIDGQESKAKASEVKTSYQKQGHLDNELRAVNQQKEALKAQESQFNQDKTQKIQQFEDINRVAYNKLQNDYQNIDWNTMREEDPAEWSAKQSEFQKQNNEIQTALGQVAQYRQHEQQQKELTERARIPDVIPEWKDSSVAEKERNELSVYMAENSINPEVANYADGIAVLRKAKLYDDLSKSKPEINKLVTKAPKVSKPGVKSTPKPAEKSIEDIFYS